jgi:NADH-quinone oxidoreductase subunit G
MTTVAPVNSPTPASGSGANSPTPSETKPPAPEGYVRLTVDGVEVLAPKNELVIRTAERLGVAIPRFCDHPLLDPVGACRQCLVEVEMGGRPMPKPQASCTMTVAEGMVVRTQVTSPVAERAQRGNLEFLLINHPLDCPICDKGGECPLQNQTLADGPGESRFHGAKRVFIKPVAISTEIMLDRDRCVLCQRCTRFSEQIAGDPFIDMLQRGVVQQVGTGPEVPFQSYFSGNTIQICPVGALTSTAYRFRSRPFDLVSTRGVCEHCAAGCAIRTDSRRNVIMRRLAGNDPAVNEEWNCDKGRFAFTYHTQDDRLATPLVRGADGELAPASWTTAMVAAAAGLAAARDASGVGVLTGGRLTVTDAYAYAKFARVALRTNDIDFRVRAHSAEELDFLTERVVRATPDSGGVSYAAIDAAKQVLLVALEPEDECPILFLRLRKASRRGARIASVAPLATRGLAKLGGKLIPAAPAAEPDLIADLGSADDDVATALRASGAVILVGERAAGVPGLLTAVGELADKTGAGLAWVPRRAGERGALLSGAAPSLLPGGRPVADVAARAEVEKVWGTALPASPGRDTAGIIEAIGAGELSGLLVGGVDLDDLPDPAAARVAIGNAGFVVSLELRRSAVTELADVVFPVASVAEKSGSFLNWEGRVRRFETALGLVGGLDDGRVLDTLGVEMDVDLLTQTPLAAQTDLGRIGSWSPQRAVGPGARVDETASRAAELPPAEETAEVQPAIRRPQETMAEAAGGTAAEPPAASDSAGFVLASHRALLDGSRAEDGEPHLAGTRRAEVARLSAGAASALHLVEGDAVTVSGANGSVVLPLAIAEMPDDVVWIPARIAGGSAAAATGAVVGDRVTVDFASPVTAGVADPVSVAAGGGSGNAGGGN